MTFLGVYLIFKDLQSLHSQRSYALEQSLFAARQFLNEKQLATAEDWKDAGNPKVRALQQELRRIQESLGLPGELSLYRLDKESLQPVASSLDDNSTMIGRDLRAEESGSLSEGRSLKSDLKDWYQNKGHYVLLSLSEPNWVIELKEQDRGFLFKLAGFGMYYLLIIFGFLGLFGSFAIWTQQRQARLMKKTMAELKNFYELSNELIIELDQDLKLQNANPSALEMMGVSLQEIAGKKLFETDESIQLLPVDQNIVQVTSKLKTLPQLRFHAKIVTEQTSSPVMEFIKLVSTEGKILLMAHRSAAELSATRNSTTPDVASEKYLHPLTGLPNSNYLVNLLETRFSELKEQACSILMIDIDDFQYFNHLHGKEEGNRLLRNFAHSLRHFFRRGDKVIHYRDDKFVVLLNHTDLKSAAKIAQNFSEEMRKSPDSTLAKTQFSVGVTQVDSQDTYEDWINRSIAALETAKQNGKAKVEVQRPNELEILA
ncbi:MAG: hypothetical protein COV44_01310 [Deltaproteobacteria bacterium CG11_big_fil_rev_8_21_14_0_20_45_16]|nr:MAG: hypothetical protein COV44_01310 [Deltaproteobacteria bacterium CG11_big_fil_rev_8_21_14_0_20_45_16]